MVRGDGTKVPTVAEERDQQHPGDVLPAGPWPELPSWDDALEPRIVYVDRDRIQVRSAREEKEAIAIVHELREKYGIVLSSPEVVKAAHEGMTDEKEKAKIAESVWTLDDLRGLKRAAAHFGGLIDPDKDTLHLGKLTAGKDREQFGAADKPGVAGEVFAPKRPGSWNQIGLMDAAEGSADSTEGFLVHEFAHSLLHDRIDDYVARGSGGYWKGINTRSNHLGAEGPATPYGQASAHEDMAEAVEMYFMAPGDLSSKCPLRFAFIDALAKTWDRAPQRR